MTESKIDYSEIDSTKEIPFIRKRCPHLHGKELEEADELFRWYVMFAWDIWSDWENEGRPDILVDGEYVNIDSHGHIYNVKTGMPWDSSNPPGA